MLPEEVLLEAAEWSAAADFFLALGSSLVVHPAAGLPMQALRHGATLVIINRTETPLDSAATLVLRGELGPTLSVVEQLLANG